MGDSRTVEGVGMDTVCKWMHVAVYGQSDALCDTGVTVRASRSKLTLKQCCANKVL